MPSLLGRVRLGYSGIYSGYSAPGSRIAGMEIQVFRNENSSQTNVYSHYSNYSYSGLIPNERALIWIKLCQIEGTECQKVIGFVSTTLYDWIKKVKPKQIITQWHCFSALSVTFM